MRLLKYLLATLLAFASPVEAAGWLPLSNPTFTQTDNGCLTVSGTTTTFTAKGLGTASPSRITAVTINWSDSTLAGTAQITAVTVAGSSALRAVRALSNGQNSNSEVWWLQLPSGTSGDIIVTSSTAINAMTIAIYSLVGFNSIAPYATTTGTTTISQAFQAKNVALEAGSRTVNVSTSLSALTNDFSSACGTGLWGVHASGALNGNGTLTSNINPTSNNPEMALAIWSVQAPVIVNCATSSLTNVIGAWDSNVFASLTLSGSTVTGIADQSGTGNNLTAAGGGAVTYNATSFNSRPGMSFNQAGLKKSSFAIGTGNTLTAWALLSLTNDAVNHSAFGRIISYTALGAAHDFDNVGSFSLFRNNLTSQVQFTRNNLGPAAVAYDYATPRRIIFTIDSSGTLTIYVDGVAATPGAGTVGNFVSAGDIYLGFSLHDSDISSGELDGIIGEAGVATGFTNSTTVATFDTCLKNKWGL